VLRGRTQRFGLVLERVLDSHNQQAVLRSAEALGIQEVFVVDPPVQRTEREGEKNKKQREMALKITKSCFKWLTMLSFDSTEACVTALREGGYTIWASDLSDAAECLSNENRGAFEPMPSKIALVIGRESDGVSPEMLAAADRRVFLPMYGFTESFNLSVASSLMLQRLFDWCPDARGDLVTSQPEAASKLRKEWFSELTRNPTAAQAMSHWLAHPDEVEPLADLRRPDGDERISWVPRKIKKREAAALEGRELPEKKRGGGGGTPADGRGV